MVASSSGYELPSLTRRRGWHTGASSRGKGQAIHDTRLDRRVSRRGGITFAALRIEDKGNGADVSLCVVPDGQARGFSGCRSR